MKILFLLNEGFDTPGPSNHIIQTLIQDVLEDGNSVHMIESRRKKLNPDIPDNLLKFEKFTYDVINRLVLKKRAFIKRYMEELFYALHCIPYYQKLKDIDVVFIQSCPTVFFPILLSKLFLRKPIVYSVQDLFPGSAVHSGVLHNQWIANLFYLIQKMAYQNSDAITVISEDMKKKVMEQGISPKKIHIIPNWFDDRSVHEVKWNNNRFVYKYGLSEKKFYVQYAGTMGYVFDYKMVLEVADALKNYNAIEFQMVGEGSQKEDFIKEKEDRKLDNIIFYPLEPQSMVSDVYSASSVCIIPLKKGIIGNSVPSKVGLVMACKRVIISSVDEESAYYQMFRNMDMGISVSNKNSVEVAKAILEVYRNKGKRSRLAQNGYYFAKKNYTRNVNTKKYIELFKIII